MSSSLRRGAVAAAAIAFSIASLASCAAGNNAETHQIRPDNAAATVGDIMVQNATIVTQPDLESTGPAIVAATIFNNGTKDQTLDSVVVDGVDKKAELTAAQGNGPLTIPAGGRLIVGGEDNASAVLPSSRTSVLDGNAQAVTFTFSRTGDVKLDTLVVPAAGYFKKWGPSDMPSAPASNSPSPESSETAGEGSGAPADGAQGEADGAEAGH
ncbi:MULTISPECIES: DUF461 domain-containing protein [Streptomyces]|uniref:Lipoprotein n=3 Tax=Streptomyces TaxID=1883 RepID=A0A8H9LUA1_9ACTN|nr:MULTISPECIES: DUF461 domain-containing protein [Streptomyces]NEE47726.1 DUF461 domain-containing protein [Streptomyces sp. SID8455]MBL3805359.1 DUF461 domain-containing protein [Streptomyces sp. BRB081]MDQ0294150.1 hypothetical protein [Streptomyces sp. DSM 41037]RPK89545.1 hypothetical protein EES47_10995 [Streptomyces sp. ADI98-12]WPR52368.1 DUF461 domain-containing protein [Streptomyces sp. S399]